MFALSRSCHCDHVFFNRTFWIFSYDWDFLSRAQFVHTKMTFSSDEKYYKRDVMMIHLDLITRFLESLYAHCNHHFLLVSLKLLCNMFVRIVCNKISCILENALFLIINRSSSMFFSKDRHCRRRMFELRWDVWTVTTRSSQNDIWMLWSSIQRCLKASLKSFFAYLFTFVLENHRTSNTSTAYNALFVFELCTSISKIRSFLLYEDNFSVRFYLFEFKQWLRFRVASFF